MRIEELELKTSEENALIGMLKPKTIAEIAAIMDIAYTSAFGKLQVWEAKGWIKKLKVKRNSKYYLNQDILEINLPKKGSKNLQN